MENFSRIITALRLYHRLSQEYVAKKLNLSQSQYSKMESGQKQFPLDKLVPLASVFRISPTALLECLMMGMKNPDEAIKSLVNKINNCTEYQGAAEEKNAVEQKVLSAYFEERYFSLYREYLKLCEKFGIEKTQKSRGG